MTAAFAADVFRGARRLLVDGVVAGPHDMPLPSALWRAAGLPAFVQADTAPDPAALAAYEEAVGALGLRLSTHAGRRETLERWDFCRGPGPRLSLLRRVEGRA